MGIYVSGNGKVNFICPQDVKNLSGILDDLNLHEYKLRMPQKMLLIEDVIKPKRLTALQILLVPDVNLDVDASISATTCDKHSFLRDVTVLRTIRPRFTFFKPLNKLHESSNYY